MLGYNCPVRISRLLWDDDTIEHIAQHSVRPEEIEQTCQAHPYVLRTHGGRYIVLGRSDAGRYLTVILAPHGRDAWKPITARPMDEAERRRYERR